MPEPDPAALAFLSTRRSRVARSLGAPGPDAAALAPILAAGARAPDHGKLEPWRFMVLETDACRRLGDLTRRMGAERGDAAEAAAKAASGFDVAPMAVAVIASPKANPKIPEVEQTLSAGAVCLQLLNAALAAGWGANWLSGWMARDAAWLEAGLGLSPPEWVAGFIHVGSETAAPTERPRPDLAALTTWVRT